MDDPAYASNMGDPDTCRICRGEGTDDDELFYPCKCSGSIKYVHQGCLMEWLSHSQKKYCELCKTPFRFTKLYDPEMPQELPMPMFLKELVVYAGKHLVTWLRFVLVSFVWLGWLPWSMRAVWRGLFWLADGHWPGSSETPFQNTTAIANETLSSLAAFGTCQATSTLVTNLHPTPSSVENVATAIPQLLSPVSTMLNFSAGEPLLYTVAKTLFSSPFASSETTASNSGSRNMTIALVRRLRQPSWLSDIEFLNTLTPYPTVNNIIIDTLEGQLITLLIVIAFILVFLIREWVVQQQPALNIAEGEREAAIQLMADDMANRRNANPRPADAQNDRRDVEPQRAPEPQLPVEDDNDIDSGRTDSDDQTPIFGPLPNAGFHIPDFGSPRPMYPSDRERASPWETEEADPASDEPDISGGVLGTSRAQNELGWRRFPDATIPGNIWNGPGNSSFASWDNRQENGGIYPLPASERQDSTSKGKEKQDDDDELHAQYSLQPRTPPFHGHLGDESSSSSRFPPYSFNREEPILGSRVERIPNMWSDDLPTEEPDVSADPLDSSGELPDLEDLESPPDSPDKAPDDNPENFLTTPQETELRQVEPPIEDHRSLVERAANFLWGDIPAAVEVQEDEGNDDEHIVENAAEEAPFIRVRHHDGIIDAVRDQPPVGFDANDADAVDDADDLEGIMELIGMQGPIFGLLQNGVFSALLISFTVSVGIWLPYLWGKIALVLLTNPVRFFVGVPLTLVSIIADVTTDTFIAMFAYAVWLGSMVLRILLDQVGILVPALQKFTGQNAVTTASMSLMHGSGHRLKRVLMAFLTYNESDLPLFSVLSHQALRVHEARIEAVFNFVYLIVRTIVYDFPLQILTSNDRLSLLLRPLVVAPAVVREAIQCTMDIARDIPSIFARNVSWSYLRVLTDGNGTVALDPELARWESKDRAIAVIMGYCFATFIGLTYLRASAFFNGPNRHERVNGAVADALRQAGGVMKVILIIGIEMIVFPLYCGILLDIALLPLFEMVTVRSRLGFTMGSPLTSLFVHWFVGTCYMFHFALFVSMCRKILRTGVLYFIRDPDDPTFHPVRDVLERSITTQLRKIAFSALVYGALVIVCLGGVVWGLFFAAKGVLPLHWSSNEPVLEFPVDLLFYNFVVPLAIRSIKPSDSLHEMYDWWFQKCGRMLRLSSFLFGVSEPDEEGHYTDRTWYAALIARLRTSSSERVVMELPDEDADKKTGFVHDGKLVRAPASDQVRIPKGITVFVPINENNERVDGKPDRDSGLHGRTNEMFTQVYIPPSFRARISAFIFLIWVFAAVTGVGATILPLLLGRRMISSLFPAHVRVNDIYAFSVGICVAGTAVYAALYFRRALVATKEHMQPYSQSPMRLFTEAWRAFCYVFRLVYGYSTLVLFLPSVFALLSELYILIPLHGLFYDDKVHVIYFIQDWTLGVLYVRMTLKVISWYPASRLAIVLKAVVRDGWLNPDMKLATRAFIIPATAAALVAFLGPLPIAYLLNATMFRQSSPAVHSMVYRCSYPMFLMFVFLHLAVRRFQHQIGVWRVNIRDDVYLIGERLHNFRERRKDVSGVPRRVITS